MNKNLLIKTTITLIIIVLVVFSVRYLKESSEGSESGFKAEKFLTKDQINPGWIERRQNDQIREAASSTVNYQFKFSNLQQESGITFKHLINPDCNISYKPVHYDHGNGLAIADVDNDGLVDIYFVSQVGAGELWKNKGDATFENITENSGLSVTGEKTSVSASFGDIDNDGDPDLYITTIRDGNFLFENDGNGKFTDISEEANVDYHGHSAGVVFVDYNLDGLLDIFVSNIGIYTTSEKANFDIDGKTYSYYVGMKDGFAGHLKEERFEQSRMYKNLGNNQFKHVSEEVGINDVGWTGDAIIIDGNNDGFPDLYVTNMQGNDLYYENQEGKKFIEKRATTFPKTPWGAMGAASFDYDNDGMQDLYITDMHSDMLGGDVPPGYRQEKLKANVELSDDFLLSDNMSLYGNAFYKKTGTNSYQEVSDDVNAENYWPWGLSNGDLNADGFEDVVITSSMNYPYRFALNSVLLNDHGKSFMDSEFLLGVEPRKEFSKPWFKLDCDGDDKEHLHCANKEGEITIWGATGSRSSAIFDLDNDGDLDIVTNEFNDVPQVLISDLSTKYPELTYIKVKLEGSKSNRDGIGAKVIISTTDQTYTKMMTGKSGYLSQGSYPLYFGLDGNNKVDEIQVIWPSGVTQTLKSPGIINDLILIKEE